MARSQERETIISSGSTRGGKRVRVERVREGGWTKKRRSQFLAALGETANVKLSAERAGVSKSLVYLRRRTDPEFADDWDAALRDGVRTLEMRLLERALHGDRKPYFYSGEKRGEFVEYPDRVAMFLISRHTEAGPGGGGPSEPLRERQARARETLAAAVERAAGTLKDAAP